VDNSFYRVPVNIVPALRGRLPLSYFHTVNASGASSNPIGRYQMPNASLYSGVVANSADSTVITQPGYRVPAPDHFMIVAPWMGPEFPWSNQDVLWFQGAYGGIVQNTDAVYTAKIGDSSYQVRYKSFTPTANTNLLYALVSFTNITSNLTYTYAHRYAYFDAQNNIPWGMGMFNTYFDADYPSTYSNPWGLSVIERFFKMGLPTDAELTGTVANEWFWGSQSNSSSSMPYVSFEPNEVRRFFPTIGWGFYDEFGTPPAGYSFPEGGSGSVEVYLPTVNSGPPGPPGSGGGGLGAVGPGGQPLAWYWGTRVNKLAWDDWNIMLSVMFSDEYYCAVRGVENIVAIGK
jgi:hypothetical protein